MKTVSFYQVNYKLKTDNEIKQFTSKYYSINTAIMAKNRLINRNDCESVTIYPFYQASQEKQQLTSKTTQ